MSMDIFKIVDEYIRNGNIVKLCDAIREFIVDKFNARIEISSIVGAVNENDSTVKIFMILTGNVKSELTVERIGKGIFATLKILDFEYSIVIHE